MSEMPPVPTTPDEVNGFLGAYGDHLGLRVVEAGPDRMVATWTVGPHLLQPHGIVHGGVHCTVVETLGSVGGAIWFGERGRVVGVSNSTDFYRAVTEGAITSTATAIHQGRSQQVWVVESRDAEGRLVSRGQLRLQNLAGHAPTG